MAFAAALPVFGGEYAVLSTGFRIHAERHEVAGSRVVLYSKDGVIEMPAAAVAWFETEEYSAPPAPDPPPAAAPVPAPVKNPATLVREAARRAGLPPALLESVARVESNLRPEAVSPKGALGVMQLMPGTAKTLGADPHDTAQNIDAGTRLLRDLLIKYDGDVVKALAAYNAGEGAVDKYQGMPPYNETRWYVKKVIDAYQKAGGQ